jgi:hypothetical protein
LAANYKPQNGKITNDKKQITNKSQNANLKSQTSASVWNFGN